MSIVVTQWSDDRIWMFNIGKIGPLHTIINKLSSMLIIFNSQKNQTLHDFEKLLVGILKKDENS